MPARLAATPRMPLDFGADIGTRDAERLTGPAARSTATGCGLGLATSVTATAMAAGAVALTLAVGVAAEAGSASEATMAPEMTITAEVLVAGLVVRERAEEKDDAELTGLGARWR